MEVISQYQRSILPITDLKCTVGCPILDDFLRGGLPCGMITEVAGKNHSYFRYENNDFVVTFLLITGMTC